MILCASEPYEIERVYSRPLHDREGVSHPEQAFYIIRAVTQGDWVAFAMAEGVDDEMIRGVIRDPEVRYFYEVATD